MSHIRLSGPDLTPSGVPPHTIGTTSPAPIMEQAQTGLSLGFNQNLAQGRNRRAGNPRAIGYYSGNEHELGIVQREPCFVRHGVYDSTGSISRATAFSGWNGIPLEGITDELSYYNAFTYVGLAWGATYINSKLDPNTPQGVTTGFTGSWSMSKHYGKKTIHVGDIICMRPPPMDPLLLKQMMDERQTGEDWPYHSKILATPEPVNPADVYDYWRKSARSLIDENFSKNGQPNPVFDLRDNLFQMGKTYTNRTSAQDQMTVQLKQLITFVGVTFAMHLIDYGLVQPVSVVQVGNSLQSKVGSSQIARQQLLAAMNEIKMTDPHEKLIGATSPSTFTASKLGPGDKVSLKNARDDFKRFLMGISGLVREDGGAVEHQKFTRMFHMRTLGYASGDARHAGIASDLTSNSLVSSNRAISLLNKYQGRNNSAFDQYHQIQTSAIETFMRKAGQVLDFQYKNCAGRAMSNSPEGTSLHACR